MEGEAAEFLDWELLQSSDETISVKSSESVDETQGFLGFEGDSEGMVRADYFSLDSQEKYSKTTVEEGDMGSVDSDNPSWIDPAGSEARYPRKNSGEFWPDSGSERSDERRTSESDQNYELGFVGNGNNLLGIGGIGETERGEEKLGKPWSESAGIESEYFHGGSESEPELSDGEKSQTTEGLLAVEHERPSENQVAAVGDVKAAGDEERKVVWLNWKLPIEILKYCAFRVSPFWSFSVAAAVMGFVILGRRLYKMKKKSQSLQLKVTLDDKKVSQFMSRTARLNEAFSIVKRVPVVRPSLPAAVGVTPWPIMSLR